MKITNYENIVTEEVQDIPSGPSVQDITQLIQNLEDKHGHINALNVEGQVFFFRRLKRGEYLQLINNEELSELEKEDIVCSLCVVHPENYDFENGDALLPSMLTKAIMKASYLDSIETRTAVLSHFRREMDDFQNQITCIINEAFPQFSLEEIEDWDMEKTAKYLSRAEWKLVHFRGASFAYDPDAMTQQQQGEEEAPQQQPQPPQLQQKQENLKGGKKEKMTPDKLAELQRMRQMFPEIDWDADAGLEGVAGIKGAEAISDLPVALREGF